MDLNSYHFNPTPFETHMLVYERIGEGSRVLDVGCATGYFAQKLKKKRCKVWGVEIDEDAARIARKYCQKVIVGDVEKMKDLPFEKNFFDYILFLDILEHLEKPLLALKLVKPYLKTQLPGKIIISVPNVAFVSTRISLFLGKFDYQKEGILDESHLHFYTKKSFLQLLRDCNLKIEEWDTASGFYQIILVGRYLNYIPKWWQYKITRLWETLLGYQFIVMCTASSTVRGVEVVASPPRRCL